MLISQMNPDELTREQITKVIFGSQKDVDDGTRNGDCILVFGAMYTSRAVKAVELFQNGRAPYILFSGGDKFGQRNPPEAILLRDEAIRLGVPNESILLETISNHTKENVMCSLTVQVAVSITECKLLLYNFRWTSFLLGSFIRISPGRSV